MMLSLLLLECNEADILLAQEGLTRCRMDIAGRVARDGEEGETLLKGRFRPDLMILDPNTPKFSGQALLERSERFAIPAVVVFTGSENDRDRPQALEEGAAEFVIKPIGLEPYRETVEGIVRLWAPADSRASLGEIPSQLRMRPGLWKGFQKPDG